MPFVSAGIACNATRVKGVVSAIATAYISLCGQWSTRVAAGHVCCGLWETAGSGKPGHSFGSLSLLYIDAYRPAVMY